MTKIAISSIAFIIISTVIVVLWQRQPKVREPAEIESTRQVQEKQEEKFTISPSTGSVINSSSVKFTGKTDPNHLVLIYANETSAITKTKGDGSFELTVASSTGINLFKLALISEDGQIVKEDNLTIYFSQKDVGTTVFAGPVKSIFDNLITLTTTGGDKNIRTSKSTSFNVPEEEDVKEATEEVDNIRIGDYVVATGTSSDDDSIIAKNLEVIRVNKPVLTKEMAIGKIASNVRQNIFSVKNDKDGKIIEFALDKNSEIQEDGTAAKSDAIAKDKTAIVLFAKNKDVNLIDLIYLLP
ncbi:hypothetical protein HYZ70_02500 [Candidatus Curtissbacteria bacterium]|nr:hypothetical protein [Candidatus Curtissbacteria bacterium]